MKNLMYQITIPLGLAIVAASLLALSPDQAQAKVKKQTGNSAKVKSQAKRVGVRRRFRDMFFHPAPVVIGGTASR